MAGDVLTAGGCAAPCWQGLTPGQSTLKDVQHLLERTDPLTILVSEYPTDTDCLVWDIGIERQDDSFEIRTIQTVGSTVSFIESDSSSGIALKHVIAQLGEPEYAAVKLAVGPDGQYFILEVYYPSRGLSFVLWPNQQAVGRIGPNIPVAGIQYYKPGDLLSYLTAKEVCWRGAEKAKAWAENEQHLIQPWSGYGKAQVFETR